MNNIGKLIGSITIEHKNNFYNNNKNTIINDEIKKDIINFLSNSNLRKEIVNLVKQYNKNKYQTCNDYIFLLGINNFFSTIMLILDNYKIEDYLVGIEGSYCIIKEKLNNYGGNVLRLFLEDEEFFYNLISTSKNNVYKYFLCLKNNFSKSEILFSINSNKLYVYQNIQRQNQEYLNNLIT